MITQEFLHKAYTLDKRSLRDIAKECRCSFPNVRFYIKKYNIPLRTSCSTPVDLINKKKYKLEYLYPTGERGLKGEIIWLCKCDCGNKTKVPSSKFKIQKSCGCFIKEVNRKLRYKGYGDLSGTFMSKILGAAGKRGLEVNLDIEFLWNLFLYQDKKCALSGKTIIIKDRNGTASLDRIDSSKGYTKENVQWVDRKVNFMKQNLKEDEFILLCKQIVKHSKKKVK